MPTSSGFQVNEVLTAANTNTYLLRPFTNCIINPAMTIAQRATTATGISTAFVFGTVDRWFSSIGSAGTWTQTQQTLTSSDPPLQDGVRNSLRLTCTTANASLGAGAFNVIGQNIEGLNLQQFAKGTLNAKPFALSFWVRATKTGTNIVELGDNANGRTISASYTISISNQWQKVRIIFSSDLTGLLPNDNSFPLTVQFWLGAGSSYTSGTLQTAWGNTNNANRAVGQVNHADAINNVFEVTGIQLEPNNVCTPFERRHQTTELLLCQRYFFKSYDQTQPIGTATFGGMVFQHGASDVFGNGGLTVFHPVEMRTTPTMTFRRWDNSSGLWDVNRNGVNTTGSPFSAYANARSFFVIIPIGAASQAGVYSYGHFWGTAE